MLLLLFTKTKKKYCLILQRGLHVQWNSMA